MLPRERRYVAIYMGRIRCGWKKESIVVSGSEYLKPFELLQIEKNETAT